MFFFLQRVTISNEKNLSTKRMFLALEPMMEEDDKGQGSMLDLGVFQVGSLVSFLEREGVNNNMH